MKKEMKELQELKGIGKVLSRRLIEASYNTIAKVAAAEEHGLEKIPGMNPQKLRSILTQAREMTAEAEKSRPKTWKHWRSGQMDWSGFCWMSSVLACIWKISLNATPIVANCITAVFTFCSRITNKTFTTGPFLGPHHIGKGAAMATPQARPFPRSGGNRVITVDQMINLDLSYAPPYSPVWDPVVVAARNVLKPL